MTPISADLWRIYHLDTVQPEHPVRRAVDEIERLHEELASMEKRRAFARRTMLATVEYMAMHGLLTMERCGSYTVRLHPGADQVARGDSVAAAAEAAVQAVVAEHEGT